MTEEKLKALIRAGFDYKQIKTITAIVDPDFGMIRDFDSFYANCHLDVILDGYEANPKTAPDP